jgi:hypothetical protein
MTNGRRWLFARRGVLTIHPQPALSITDGSGSLPRTGLLTDVFETDSGTTSLLTTSPVLSESNPHHQTRLGVGLGERFWSKVDKSGECWIWTASGNGSGYGQIRTSDGLRYAHRLAYEDAVGAIPEGLQLDHLCRNRACVNPDHLEPVTNRENARRGERAQRTHCPQGHPYDEENTQFRPDGRRLCAACNRENARRKYCWCGGVRGAGKPAYDAGTWHHFDGTPCKGCYQDGEQ